MLKVGCNTSPLLGPGSGFFTDLTRAGGEPFIEDTEHGWPTGPTRTRQRQAEGLRTVVDVIAGNADELNITGYIHHTLRDACSAGDGLFCQFGLMTDDYIAKPAFHVYRNLIDALSR